MFKELPLVFEVPLPRTIPCARSIETILAEVVNEYREGMTSNHFAEGGIDLITISLQVSSNIGWVLKLSTAALWVRNNFMWS